MCRYRTIHTSSFASRLQLLSASTLLCSNMSPLICFLIKATSLCPLPAIRYSLPASLYLDCIVSIHSFAISKWPSNVLFGVRPVILDTVPNCSVTSVVCYPASTNESPNPVVVKSSNTTLAQKAQSCHI